MSVVTGKPVSALTRAKTFIPSTRPGPAIARPGRPIGLVERGLEDQRDAERAADLDQAARDPQRHVARLHHARTGDQGQRAIPADLDLDRP